MGGIRQDPLKGPGMGWPQEAGHPSQSLLLSVDVGKRGIMGAGTWIRAEGQQEHGLVGMGRMQSYGVGG